MEGLSNRFEQSGGLYKKSEKSKLMGKNHKPSPKNNNWKKKYLESKLEIDNLKQENKILKSQIKELKN